LQQQQQQQRQPQPPLSGGAGGAAATTALEAKINQLQGELREEKVRYESLEEEQEELLIALAKIEIENNNLKERVAQLEQHRL
jgi:chromosome segregation ATPase